jgi:hypothetical protein
MASRDRKYFQQGINMYVKAMQYSSDMLGLEPQAFSLGTPALANPTKYATGLVANSGVNAIVALPVVGIADATYGRTVTYTPSAVPGNANIVDVIGQDYLGQPMVERFTGSAAASTLIAGKKAFFRILSTRVVTASTNAITFSIGSGTGLGLPYKGLVSFSHEAGALVLPSQITSPAVFTVPDLTDPATPTTGDPRGTYQSIMAMDGVSRIDVEMFGDSAVNAAGNGGFLGIQHFYA